ncbi:MAG: phage/plasmid replication protein, II/X family [Methylovulum sp.]
MIDMLVLRCDFKKDREFNVESHWPTFTLALLNVPVEQSIDRDGHVFNTRHPWEKIPSSYDSMAFKIFDHRYDPLDMFYIEIKASPAKIMQGHNIYGSSDFYDCCMHLLELLCMNCVDVAEHLDHSTWSLSQIDITFSSRAQDDKTGIAFINSLQNVSYGQTKPRTGFGGTAYFGKKNSRLKKIKVYSKFPEVQETIKNNETKKDGHLLNEVYTSDLLDFSKGLIRWEASLYHRYFERLGISTSLKDLFYHHSLSPSQLQNYWILATSDLFNALKGHTMKTLNNTEVKDALRLKFSKISKKTGKVSMAAADSAFKTYLDIRRDGWVVSRDSMPIRTFDHHVKMLTESGLSRAALQNMDGLTDGALIIPFVRFIQVEFAAQFPADYVQPASVHVYEPQPRLRLVA